MAKIYTLGQLIKFAEKNGVEPAVHGGSKFFTIDFHKGGLELRPTSKQEYDDAKRVSPRKEAA